MMKYIRCIAALCALLTLATPASAFGLHHGNAVNTPNVAPILTDTSYTYGRNSRAFTGVVRLSQQDRTSPSYIPFTASGLGLMSPNGPPCDTWYESFVSGRSSSDFAISATIAEGSLAYTPLLTSTGQNNITGDYVFHYQCSANGVMSNVATLTIHTNANAVNFSQYDHFDFGWAASGFGSATGSKIQISTGADLHNVKVTLRGVTLGSTLANPVTITVADSGRYPYMSNFTTSGLSNIVVSDIVATGNTDVGIQAATNIFGSAAGATTYTGATWNNLRYYGSPYMYPSTSTNSGQTFFSSACTANCLFENSVADFVNSGFNIADNLHVTNVDIGHYANNCTAIISQTVGATVDGFTVCHDGLISVSGQHTDVMQILDGATAWGDTIQNFWAIQAGATGQPQGPIFGGGQFGNKNNAALGYIDDCTGSHGPGKGLTFTNAGMYSSSSGSQIWIPSGGIAIADKIHIFGSPGQTSCITTDLPSNVNIGSPGSPVAIFNVGAYNLQMEGIINTNGSFNGFASSGESGTSFLRHFSYVQQVSNPIPATSFTASINGAIGSYAAGTTATVAGAGTTNYSGILEPILFGQLAYSGCTTCGTGGTSIGGEAYSTEPVQATANASFSGKTMTVTGPCTGRFDYGIANGAHTGGLMISGTGIPDYVYIVPQLSLPSDGCAGNYTLSLNVGTLGSRAITGRPQQGAGVYGLFGTTGVPGGPYAMTAVNQTTIAQGAGGYVSQTQSAGSPGCVSGLHQGSFNIDKGFASFISTCGPTDAPNTTVTNTVTPVAADFNTGALPYTTLNAISSATWNAMTTAQKIAATCNALLPALGGALDLGGGSFIGALTHTGEVQLAGGNVPVPGCGIH